MVRLISILMIIFLSSTLVYSALVDEKGAVIQKHPLAYKMLVGCIKDGYFIVDNKLFMCMYISELAE